MFARRLYLLNALKVFDLAVVIGAFGVGGAVAYDRLGKTISLSEFIQMRVALHNFFIFTGLVGLWHLGFRYFGLYRSRRLSSRWSEALDIVKATSAGTVVLAAASAVFDISIATSAFLVTFWVVSTAFMAGSRLALRYFLHSVRLKGRNLRHLLLVGTNARTFAFARQIETRPELGYQVMGFVDERRDVPQSDLLARYGLVCDFDGFPEFLRTHIVDEVVVALPVRSLYAQAARIVEVCEEQGVSSGSCRTSSTTGWASRR